MKGAGQFGSGWVWLVLDTDGKVKVTNTPNGVNPLCFGQTALLGCDVWEHSRRARDRAGRRIQRPVRKAPRGVPFFSFSGL